MLALLGLPVSTRIWTEIRVSGELSNQRAIFSQTEGIDRFDPIEVG